MAGHGGKSPVYGTNDETSRLLMAPALTLCCPTEELCCMCYQQIQIQIQIQILIQMLMYCIQDKGDHSIYR